MAAPPLPPPPPCLFSLKSVRQDRGAKAILHDVTLDIPRGEITALVGPSGAGKTSLLRLLNRLDEPSAGSLTFDGRPVDSYPVAALRRRVGFFQTAVMFPGTVADNLAVALELGGAAPPESSRQPAPTLDRIMTDVGLAPDYLPREAARLSGGEQQRVSLARALMTSPDVLLLDEPTSALDPEVAERLLATIVGLTSGKGMSVVMVTHRLAEARHASTHIVMLESGRVVEAGPTAQLFAGATSERTRAYLGTND
jgi:putative ABC transport system ATP-binding protein